MKIISLAVGIFLFQTFAAIAQNKNFIDQPYVETTAMIDTLVVPDKIFLTVLLTEKDTKGKTSVEELEAKMVAALNQLGIDTKKDLALNDLASNFKKYFLKKQDILKAKEYSLMLKDAPTVGRVLQKLEELEIANVQLDRTEFSGIEQLKLELKSLVMAKAKKQAEYLASPLNQKIGPAIFIQDLANFISTGSYAGAASGIKIRGTRSITMNSSYPPAEIEFEKIKVECSVQVKFKLEQ